VLPLAPEKPKSKGLVMSANGRYQLIPESVKNFSFRLENRGERWVLYYSLVWQGLDVSAAV
jgi:hypothetical protein